MGAHDVRKLCCRLQPGIVEYVWHGVRSVGVGTIISARMLCVVPCKDIDRCMRVWRRVGGRFTDPARVAHGRYVGPLLWYGLASQ